MAKTIKSQSQGGEYIFDNKLGQGAQASVFQVFHKVDGVEQAVYAVKQTPTDYLIYSKPEDKS